MLRLAQRDGRRVEREKQAWTQPLADLIFSAVAASRGQTSKSVELLEKAVVQFERVDMVLYAAATRRRLGQLTGGKRGRELITAADNWMSEQNILNPPQMTRALAPGFASHDHGQTDD